MPRIFISYRRDDSGYAASIVRNQLEGEFGVGSVFMDIDNIPLGVDFRTHLADAVATCDVLVALIGETWAGASQGGVQRRIDDAKDFVRIEIEAALHRGIPVVPVLVDKAQLPAVDSLPESLRELVFRNAAEVRAGRDQAAQLAALAKGLRKHLGEAPAKPPPAAPGPNADMTQPVPTDLGPAHAMARAHATTPPTLRRARAWALAAVVASLAAAGWWFVVDRSGNGTSSAVGTKEGSSTTPTVTAPEDQRGATAASMPGTAPAVSGDGVKPTRPSAVAAPSVLDLSLFVGYSVAIYYPEGDAVAGNTARAIQAELAARGLRQGVQVRAATAEFLRSVVPPDTLEVRYEQGIENAQAQAIVAALATGSTARQAKLLPVERRTANFLSVFVPAGG